MIGKMLKKLRTEKGLSQWELGAKLNVSQQAVGQWERDTRDPDSDMIKRIANYLEVTTDYLMGNSTAADDNLRDVMNFKKEDILLFLEKLKNNTVEKKVKWKRLPRQNSGVDDTNDADEDKEAGDDNEAIDAKLSFWSKAPSGVVWLMYRKKGIVALWVQFDETDDSTIMQVPYDPEIQRAINDLYNLVYAILPNIENFFKGYFSQDN